MNKKLFDTGTAGYKPPKKVWALMGEFIDENDSYWDIIEVYSYPRACLNAYPGSWTEKNTGFYVLDKPSYIKRFEFCLRLELKPCKFTSKEILENSLKE